MKNKRQSISFLVTLLLVAALLAHFTARRGESSGKLVFAESLDQVAASVDGSDILLRDAAYYIACVEQNIEAEARVYDREHTGKYWFLYTNHTSIMSEGKQAALDLAIHDAVFYQMAVEEGMGLTAEEEEYLANSQGDFLSDLDEEQRERLGASDGDLREAMRRSAIAEKYMRLYAAMNGREASDYEAGSEDYERLLEEHEVTVGDAWERVPFGSITVDH